MGKERKDRNGIQVYLRRRTRSVQGNQASSQQKRAEILDIQLFNMRIIHHLFLHSVFIWYWQDSAEARWHEDVQHHCRLGLRLVYRLDSVAGVAVSYNGAYRGGSWKAQDKLRFRHRRFLGMAYSCLLHSDRSVCVLLQAHQGDESALCGL